MGFSRQEYWSGLPFPSPGTFLTQGWSLGLLDCRQIFFFFFYHLSHQVNHPVRDTFTSLTMLEHRYTLVLCFLALVESGNQNVSVHIKARKLIKQTSTAYLWCGRQGFAKNKPPIPRARGSNCSDQLPGPLAGLSREHCWKEAVLPGLLWDFLETSPMYTGLHEGVCLSLAQSHISVYWAHPQQLALNSESNTAR